MATTRLSDVILPEVYLSYSAIDSPEKTAFYDSGVIVANEMLNGKANEGGDTVNLPFWNDLDSTVAPNLSSDDPASSAVPNKLTTGKQIARMAYLNQFYSNAQLASEIAGSNANQQVRNRFGTYWMRQWQKRLIASTNGILADNIANDSGDMVKSVANEDGANATATEKFNLNAFVDAVYTLGDMAEDLTAIAVHSSVMAQMKKNNDIDFIPDSEGRMVIPTYQGLRVIVDDGMTVTAGATSGFKYTSVLFGQGAFGYGNGSPTNPIAFDTEELQGDGGGVDYLGERKTWLLHPSGFADVGTPTGNSYSLAELATAGVWDRVVERKNVPLAYMITN